MSGAPTLAGVQARFSKVNERRRTVQLTWSEGFTATMPQYNHVLRFPHDLEHYIVDAVLRPPYGFWELAAAKAPFASLTPCRPWPREKREWFAKVLRQHRDEMVEAERLTGLLPGQCLSWREAHHVMRAAWTERPGSPRPELTAAGYRRITELHEQIRGAWEELPEGDHLTVIWPPPPW